MYDVSSSVYAMLEITPAGDVPNRNLDGRN
jgi:hypothetical protein